MTENTNSRYSAHTVTTPLREVLDQLWAENADFFARRLAGLAELTEAERRANGQEALGELSVASRGR